MVDIQWRIHNQFVGPSKMPFGRNKVHLTVTAIANAYNDTH